MVLGPEHNFIKPLRNAEAAQYLPRIVRMQLDLIELIISERASLFNKAGVDSDFTYIVQIAADLQFQAALAGKTKYFA